MTKDKLFVYFVLVQINFKFMTYTLTLTPYLAAQLAACCLHAGMDVCNIFPAYLTRHTTPAEESPAVLTALGLPSTTPPAAVLPTQPRPAAPVEEKRTSLIRPGMTIPAGDVDPEDESLYI